MTVLAPMTAFAGVPIALVADEGRVTDWARPLVVVSEKIPNSNTTITQVDGYEDWRLETTVMVRDTATWRAFDALRGTRGTLRHLEALTATATADVLEYHFGDLYVAFPDVLYASLDETSVRRLRDGRVIARVTFTRGA